MRLHGSWASRGGERVLLPTGELFVHRPTSPTPGRAALLWIHGGGLIYGDAREDAPYLQRFANELGLVVASVQYRLAPRDPFPAALDDCVAAFDWLAEQPDVDPGRIVVGGMSAGGGLAAALAQRLVARGGHAPTFQLLDYPMLDSRSAWAPGTTEDEQHRLWDRRSNAVGWSSYLKGHDPGDPPPFAAAARTTDLQGLPPAWIGVGTCDLFHEEDVTYAERLKEAGVAVDLVVVDGAFHGFDVAVPAASVSKRFTQDQIDAVTKHLAGLTPAE